MDENQSQVVQYTDLYYITYGFHADSIYSYYDWPDEVFVFLWEWQQLLQYEAYRVQLTSDVALSWDKKHL